MKFNPKFHRMHIRKCPCCLRYLNCQLHSCITCLLLSNIASSFYLLFFRARRVEVQACPATEEQDEHEYSPSREADSSEKEGD